MNNMSVPIPAVVMTCLNELYNLDERDELAFDFLSRPSDEPIEYHVVKLNELEDGLGQEFFYEQREIFDTNDEPECINYTDEEIYVVYIYTIKTIYGFLVLGDNGSMAITVEKLEQNEIYFYMPFVDERFDTYNWNQVLFPVE